MNGTTISATVRSGDTVATAPATVTATATAPKSEITALQTMSCTALVLDRLTMLCLLFSIGREPLHVSSGDTLRWALVAAGFVVVGTVASYVWPLFANNRVTTATVLRVHVAGSACALFMYTAAAAVMPEFAYFALGVLAACRPTVVSVYAPLAEYAGAYALGGSVHADVDGGVDAGTGIGIGVGAGVDVGAAWNGAGASRKCTARIKVLARHIANPVALLLTFGILAHSSRADASLSLAVCLGILHVVWLAAACTCGGNDPAFEVDGSGGEGGGGRNRSLCDRGVCTSDPLARAVNVYAAVLWVVYVGWLILEGLLFSSLLHTLNSADPYVFAPSVLVVNGVVCVFAVAVSPKRSRGSWRTVIVVLHVCVGAYTAFLVHADPRALPAYALVHVVVASVPMLVCSLAVEQAFIEVCHACVYSGAGASGAPGALPVARWFAVGTWVSEAAGVAIYVRASTPYANLAVATAVLAAFVLSECAAVVYRRRWLHAVSDSWDARVAPDETSLTRGGVGGGRVGVGAGAGAGAVTSDSPHEIGDVADPYGDPEHDRRSGGGHSHSGSGSGDDNGDADADRTSDHASSSPSSTPPPPPPPTVPPPAKAARQHAQTATTSSAASPTPSAQQSHIASTATTVNTIDNSVAVMTARPKPPPPLSPPPATPAATAS